MYWTNCINEINRNFAITSATNYETSNVCFLQKDCPTGELSRKKFLSIYSTLFPEGKAGPFYEHVFRTFDEDGSGRIDFKEFLQVPVRIMLSDLRRALFWTFAVNLGFCCGISTENDHRLGGRPKPKVETQSTLSLSANNALLQRGVFAKTLVVTEPSREHSKAVLACLQVNTKHAANIL